MMRLTRFRGRDLVRSALLRVSPSFEDDAEDPLLLDLDAEGAVAFAATNK